MAGNLYIYEVQDANRSSYSFPSSTSFAITYPAFGISLPLQRQSLLSYPSMTRPIFLALYAANLIWWAGIFPPTTLALALPTPTNSFPGATPAISSSLPSLVHTARASRKLKKQDNLTGNAVVSRVSSRRDSAVKQNNGDLILRLVNDYKATERSSRKIRAHFPASVLRFCS